MPLFSKKWFLIAVLISFLLLQLILGFLRPTSGSNDNWLPITAYLPKFETQDSDSFFLKKVYPLISPEYRLGSDVGNYLELAKNFNPEYFRGHYFLGRPLYSFLVFLASLPVKIFTSVSYGIIFGLTILLNFIFASLAVILFFTLLEKLFSRKVAFLSSFLLIFSPQFHVSLSNPRPETMMVFAVALVSYFIYNYAKKPSGLKLIVFSLVVGIFMLGKMFFAISLFLLLLALYFKRYKEGTIFLVFHLAPLLFWYLWVTQVWQIPYKTAEIHNWQMGVWLFNILQWPWHKTLGMVFDAAPRFIWAVVYGFILIPLIFSKLGSKAWSSRLGRIFYFGPFICLLFFFFVINFYAPYHAFLLYPIIYPTCILGIERTSRSLVFQVLAISLIIFLSNMDIFRVFDWFWTL